MIIDATDLVLGRLATVAAKKSLMNEEVKIVNCENAVITGNRKRILSDFKQKYERGVPLKGPYFPKMPDRIVKRAVRGMLPYKKPKGREAYKRIKCYIGVPEELKGKSYETIEEANIKKLPNVKYVTIKEISRFLGAKIYNKDI